MLHSMGTPLTTRRCPTSPSKKALRASLLMPALMKNASKEVRSPAHDLVAAMKVAAEEVDDDYEDETELPSLLHAGSKIDRKSYQLLGRSFTTVMNGSFVGETPTFRPHNYISQLLVEMEEALLSLNATNMTLPKLESMAILIYESMSISTRNYHSVQHVFDLICQGLENNPIAILAACFHDCIYYNVDGGLTPTQAKVLEGSIRIENDESCTCCSSSGWDRKFQSKTRYQFFATTTETSPKHTRLLPMVEMIFGYTPGQEITIPRDGLNEFLSAVVAVQQLHDHLPIEILAEIACCIQATIPFRKANLETGRSHMEQLYENMIATRTRFGLHLSDDQVVASVQRACLLSNSDVGNFGTTDRFWFLDNAWRLLPETNESLRDEYVYTVQQFHKALSNMYSFFGFLQPEVVFHEFQGVPTSQEISRLTDECRNNVKFGKTYVGAKLLAMSLLAALAVLSGGDEAPISLFTGDLRPEERRRSSASISLSDNKNEHITPSATNVMLHSRELPPPSEANLAKCTNLVYEILAIGRRTETSFDIKRSPWAAYLYASMGDEELSRIMQEQVLYPMNQERAWSLLRALPRTSVEVIAEDMCDIALSRAELIRDIVAQLDR
jgi:hypothetical protein